jgi:hypothetical protein
VSVSACERERERVCVCVCVTVCVENTSFKVIDPGIFIEMIEVLTGDTIVVVVFDFTELFLYLFSIIVVELFLYLFSIIVVELFVKFDLGLTKPGKGKGFLIVGLVDVFSPLLSSRALFEDMDVDDF